jgi:ribosomal protein S18 acetylase RimI-like enzyme
MTVTSEMSMEDIKPIPFFKKMIGLVENESCGTHEAGADASYWIRGDGYPNVRTELNRSTRVWIYENMQEQIVGFGSLGTISWLFGSQAREIQFIPMIGVFHQHQGERPHGDGESKYCYQIMDHLIDEAHLKSPDMPLIGLSVRNDNEEAIHIYEQYGFVLLQKKKNVSRMLANLS